MLDDLNQSFEIVMMWLDQLPALAVQVGGVFIDCAVVTFTLTMALRLLNWLYRLTVGRFK